MTFRMFSRELLIFMQCPDLKKHHLPLLILTTPLLPLRNVTIRWWLKSSGKVVDELHSILVGGFNPFEKIWVKMGIFHKWGGENKHIFELPPPTFSLWNVSFNFLGVRLPNQHDLLTFFSTRTLSFLSIPTAMAWTSRVNPFREHRIVELPTQQPSSTLGDSAMVTFLGWWKRDPLNVCWCNLNWGIKLDHKLNHLESPKSWNIIFLRFRLVDGYHICAPFCHPKFMIPSREVTYPTGREKEHHLQKCLWFGVMLVPRRLFNHNLFCIHLVHSNEVGSSGGFPICIAIGSRVCFEACCTSNIIWL